MLSTQESADPATVVAAPSRKIETLNDTGVENNKGKINTSKQSSTAKALAAATQRDTRQSSRAAAGDTNEESSTDGSKRRGDDINDIPESRTMLIQINDEDTTISWLDLSHDDDTTSKGVWAPQPQIQSQQPKVIPTGTTLIQSSQGRNYSFPPVAPATVRVPKRDAESAIPIDTSHDAYHQHAIGGYNAAMGQPLAPALPHPPYPYNPISTTLRKDGLPPPQYGGTIWPYTAATTPFQQRQTNNPYVIAQQRPVSPAPAIGAPGGPMMSASSPSPSVTAGEAAAMRRKKPRREFEAEDNPDVQHPHPSPPPPPPPPPAPIVPQLHHPNVNYGQIPLAPGPPHPTGPPSMHQQPQHHPAQIHQEQQPWMVYQQMYQAQLHPMKNRYTNDPPRMTVHTPESASRKFHPHDESPNNVTMTPGPGDAGGDNDSDDNEFNRPTVL